MHGYEFSSDDNSCFNDSNITKKPRLKYVRAEESDRVDVKKQNIRRNKKKSDGNQELSRAYYDSCYFLNIRRATITVKS